MLVELEGKLGKEKTKTRLRSNVLEGIHIAENFQEMNNKRTFGASVGLSH